MIEDLRRGLGGLWGRLTWSQRFSFLGLLVVIAGTIGAVVVWANTPTYEVLFSGLSNQDAGSIITQLNSSKVPYQLDNGGATILVPASMVDKERLQLASMNLPAGDVVGWESFDQTSVFQSDPMTEQVNYTRALEGELTRTISQISGVSYAKVNVVIPQQQLFTDQQASPTGSVLVKMLPGADLTGDQITGIQHLVASAVEGLKADDVIVVDGSGNVLSNNSGTAGLGAGMTVLSAETRYAGTLEAQLAAMLDAALGPDTSIVRVNDTMDFTQRDQTSNTYDVQSPRSAISESHIVTDTSIGPSTLTGGVPGLASNVPNYGTTSKSTSGVTQTQQSADIVYAHSNTIAHVTSAPGTVQRLSVAVLLDSAAVSNTRTLSSLRTALAAAAGLDPKRGDVLTVTTIPFGNQANLAAQKAASGDAQQQFILGIARWAALIVVPLILLLLLRRVMGSSDDEEDEDEDEGDLPAIAEVKGETPLLTAAVTKPNAQELQRLQLQQSMSELAREKPEVVAGVIGRWIEEDAG